MDNVTLGLFYEKLLNLRLVYDGFLCFCLSVLACVLSCERSGRLFYEKLLIFWVGVKAIWHEMG